MYVGICCDSCLPIPFSLPPPSPPPQAPNHIVEHDYKQILSLIWQLIAHYHITETSKGSKSLLLDWFSTTLPDKEIFNFTTSWRDGRNLSALINYCDPDLLPDHSSLDPASGLENTKHAMKLAEDKLGIPQVVSPEELTSERSEERSTMVYLAYFVRENSPGQKRLLEWLQEKIPENKLTDLSTAWVDGRALGALTHALSGGEFQAHEEFKSDTAVENCKRAMEAAENLLGVDQTLKPEEFANPEFNTIIRSTYLTQFLYASSHPKMVNMHIPEQAGPSSVAYIDIICPEGVSGEVDAFTKSYTAGRTQASAESTGENQYRISFPVENPEMYTLTVSVGGKRVKGSPFPFNLTRPDPNAVKHVNTILPKKAGIPALLLFDLADAGKGKLTCNVTGETSGEVINSAEMMSPTSCKISFFPWENDVYNVFVNFNGERVKDSPFSVSINNLLQPERVAVGKPEAAAGVGKPVTIPVDISKAGEASLIVKCVGEKAGEIETFPLQVDDQEKPTGVTFTPPIEDVYSVSIVFGNTEVEGSPITINLIPPPPDPKKVKLSKSPSGALDAGQLIVVGFDTSKAGKGELKAMCTGKKLAGELEVQVKEVSPHNHEVSFTPPTMDDYKLEVTWNGEQVTGSPFMLGLMSKDHPKPDNVKLVGFPTPKDILIIGEEIGFQVDTKTAGKGVLKVTVESEASRLNTQGQKQQEVAKGEPSDVGESGDTTKEAKDDGAEGGSQSKEDEQKPNKEESTETPGSPRRPPPPPPPPLLPSQQQEQQEKPEQPEQSQQTEQQKQEETREQKGESAAAVATPASPAISVTPEPSEPIVEQSRDNPKVYNVTYKPNASGEHIIRITWAGELLPSFPKALNIIRPRMAEFGSPIKIELKTNYKRKHLKVQAVARKGNKEFKVRMDKIATGHYVLGFHPKEPGIYLLHVATKEKKLEDSPYIIDYTDKAVKPEGVKVSGLGEKVYVGEPIIFTINTKSAGDGEVSVYRQSMGSVLSLDSTLTQEGEAISLHLQPNDDGTYSAVYTPTAPGEEHLDVRFAGVPIPGSPFPVSVLKKDDEGGEAAAAVVPAESSSASKGGKKKKGTISGFDLDNERFLVGATQKFKLHCEELGEGTLDVTCKPQNAAEIDVTTTTGKNSYWVEITPKKAGKHDIIVRYAGKHITGSPFRVQFLSRGDALKCSMVDPLSNCPTEIENEVVFCISTKGAGKGKLKATAKSISTQKEVPTTVTKFNSQKHHHHVQFPPTEGLNYTLNVFYDELHIQGSPFRIALGDASRCRTSGDGLIKAWTQKWNKFAIDSEEAGPGELSVIIEGEDLSGADGENNRVEPNISQLDDFHHEVAYLPSEVGSYWITIKWGNIEIPGSPFCIPCRRPLDPSQFAIEEIVTQTFLGKPAQITVNCNEAIEEDDKLTISVHSPQDERHQGEVVRSSDKSYSCTITPPSLGNYKVYILWDEKHIPESPFDIENVPVPSGEQFTIEATEAEYQMIAMKVHGPKYVFRYGQLSATVKNTTSDNEPPVTVTKNNHEESLVQFKPAHGEGEHVVKITYNDQDIQGSPFTLVSTDASQCYAKGKGIQKAAVNRENKFAVFTENGGPGELRVEIEGEVQGEGDILVEPLVTAASETRYDVSYFPTVPGAYRISVFWDIYQISGSPFNIYCCDPHRYVIDKPPKDGILGKPIKVAIKEKSESPEEEILQIYGAPKERLESKLNGDIWKGSDESIIASIQPPELGKYIIHVQCNGYDIQGSPFKTKMMPPPTPEKVIASGPGLQDGKASQPSTFTVDVSEGGHGYLSFQVQGPKHGFKINLQRDTENKDIIKGEYNPTYPGTYIVALLWSGVHIPNSPFTVDVKDADPEILTYQPEPQE